MRPWIKMVLCLIAIWTFVVVSPIILRRISSYNKIVERSEELGIDNAALFYSEEPLTSIAEQKIRDRLRPDSKGK